MQFHKSFLISFALDSDYMVNGFDEHKLAYTRAVLLYTSWDHYKIDLITDLTLCPISSGTSNHCFRRFVIDIWVLLVT